jgi:tetratricopeptide (TPR) repeat protein
MRLLPVALRRLVFLILSLLLAVMAMAPHYALALTADQVYERVKDLVVVVKAYDRAGKAVGLGSGVVLPSGDIVTNYHVVKAGVQYTVGQKGKAVPAFLQGSDPDKDLALLLAPGLQATPACLGQASRLKVGEKVFAVGAPQGLELSLSEGIVSQLRGGPPPIIQTTVAISHGSSGGGLFNAQGELVGIMTFYLEGGQSLNFALPVEWIGEVARNKTRDRPREKWVDIHEPGKARTLFEAGDLKGLLAYFRQWTQAEPSDSRAWLNLGIAYAFLDCHQEAIAAYRESLRLKPDDAFKWFELGLAYEEIDRHQEAIKAYQESLRLKPDDAKAWNKLACAYVFSGNHSAALEAVKELRRYDPQKADELFNIIMKP